MLKPCRRGCKSYGRSDFQVRCRVWKTIMIHDESGGNFLPHYCSFFCLFLKVYLASLKDWKNIKSEWLCFSKFMTYYLQIKIVAFLTFYFNYNCYCKTKQQDAFLFWKCRTSDVPFIVYSVLRVVTVVIESLDTDCRLLGCKAGASPSSKGSK